MTSDAEAFFAAKLRFETDPADLAADRAAGRAPVVLDVRSEASWRQGRIPGAIHVPHADLAERVAAIVPDLDAPIVVYCWGPAREGPRATRSGAWGSGVGRVPAATGAPEAR